jgi:hypothetical protein
MTHPVLSRFVLAAGLAAVVATAAGHARADGAGLLSTAQAQPAIAAAAAPPTTNTAPVPPPVREIFAVVGEGWG